MIYINSKLGELLAKLHIHLVEYTLSLFFSYIQGNLQVKLWQIHNKSPNHQSSVSRYGSICTCNLSTSQMMLYAMHHKKEIKQTHQ